MTPPFPSLEPLEPRTLLSNSLETTGIPIADFGAPVTSSVVADFTGDGRPDIAVAAGKRIFLLRKRPSEISGTGLYQTIFAAELKAPVGLLAVADVNRDGLPDLVAAQISQRVTGTGFLRLLLTRRVAYPDYNQEPLSASRQIFITSAITTFSGRASSITIGNLDGDQRPDIILTTDPVRSVVRDFFQLPQFPTKRGLTRWFDVSNTDFRSRPLAQGDPDQSPHAAPLLIDLNGDGRDELVSVLNRLLPTSTANTGRYVSNRSDIVIRSFSDGRMRIVDVKPLNVMVTSIQVADLYSNGQSSLVFSWYTGYSRPVSGALEVGVGTIQLGATTGPDIPRLGAVNQRLASFVFGNDNLYDEYPSSQRILGVRDLNGDGRLDIAVVSVYGYLFFPGEPPPMNFSQIIQRSDSSFVINETHLFQTSSAANSYGIAPRYTQSFIFDDIRQIGRPDLLVFQSARTAGSPTTIGLPRLTLYLNSEVRKAPIITAGFISNSDFSSPPRADVYVMHADSVRFVTISSVEVYVDVNQNNMIDMGDTLLSTGPVTVFQNGDFPFDLSPTYSIALQPIPSSARLLAVVTDSRGTRSDPFRFT